MKTFVLRISWRETPVVVPLTVDIIDTVMGWDLAGRKPSLSVRERLAYRIRYYEMTTSLVPFIYLIFNRDG